MAEANNMRAGCDGDNKLYKGVRKRKWGKWVSEVRLPNSRDRIWLGSYDSPLKAARAFDAALYCLRGCRANFNFPDTPLNLEDINVDRSFTAHEIQVIAAKFANECPSSIEQQHGGASNGDDSAIGLLFDESTKAKSDGIMTQTTTSTATTYTGSSSTSNSNAMHECDGDMDWAFLNELGDSSVGSYHYGLYSDLDKLHPGEFLMCSNTISPPNFDHQIEDDDDDPFSHQPFLWNWKF